MSLVDLVDLVDLGVPRGNDKVG